MHILFISQYFRPELGAASERISRHAFNLAKFGHEVTVITGYPNYPGGKVYPGYRRKLFSVEVIEGVRVVRVWLWTTTKKGAASRLLNYLSFMLASTIVGVWLGKMDRVVATSGPIFVGLSGYIVSAIKRASFIFDVRDIWPERIYAGTKLKRGWLLGVLERLEIFLYRKAARIIAVTHGVKENIVSKGINPEKVTVITNGVDMALFAPKTRNRVLAEKLGLDGNEFIVIYTGTLGLLQDIDLIVECALRLKKYGDIVFLLVGDGPVWRHCISAGWRRPQAR
jgi:glycosyltransferase involved in cell wall biosynthesis